ncbi:MAG TPA: hypothetical protein VLA33_02355 [Gemmatimonadota bacterium]|nr:hypothetical protein [Gemmatimonadota bacterium]
MPEPVAPKPPTTAEHPRLARALPTLADLIFIGITSLVITAAALPILTGDGDLASHIRMGQLILAERAIPLTYPFSFAMGDARFLGHAWLGEVVLAATHSAGGLAAILVLSGVLIGLCFAVLFRFLVARGVGVYPALAATGLAAGGSALHWLGRSHLFTWYFALLLLVFLEGRRGRAWLLAPAFVLWTNLHGGFTYGILLIALYLAAAKLDAVAGSPDGAGSHTAPGTDRPVATAARPDGWGARWQALVRTLSADQAVRFYGACLAWALAGSLLNPRGPFLYVEIGALLGDASIIDQINEFRSPDFHWGFATPFLAALLLSIAALGLRRERMPTAWLLVLGANTYYALYSARNIPLFMLIAFPLVVIFASRGWRWLGARADGGAASFVRQKALQGPGWLSFVFAGGLALLAVNHGRLSGTQLLPGTFSPDRFPVETVRDARRADLQGPIFNEMIWGGYVAYAWPERRSFLDGLIYDGDLLEEYRTVALAKPGWRAAIADRGFRLALVPPDGPLAEHLVDEPGWGLWDCDGTAVILVRDQGGVRGEGARTRLEECRAEREAREGTLPRLTE